MSPEPPGGVSAEVRRRLTRLLEAHDPATTPPRALWGAQFDLGLAWVTFPPGAGGLGATATDQLVVDATLGEAGVPGGWTRNPVGIGIVGPLLAAEGDDAQRRRWLRPAFTTEEVWCQLFSERQAGSDLAAVATTARAEAGPGSAWVVDGEKVWTTLGHRARWGLLLARTGPAGSRHRGLTTLVVDMDDPGVTVRPLRMLTGEAEFNEVTLRGVRVPDEARIGPPGGGWGVALSLLGAERSSIGTRVPARGRGPIAEAVRQWHQRWPAPAADGGGAEERAVARDRLVALWIEAEAVRLTNLRARQNLAAGTVGPEAATAKLTFARLNQRASDLTLDLMGVDGLCHPGGYRWSQPEEVGWAEGETSKAYLRSRANSVEGGTSEILLSVIAQRVLGLPGEPRG